MLPKSFISFLFISIILIVGFGGVRAQSAPVSGRVELLKGDGTREPVAGALIEVYRVDIKAGFPSTKTNKKGEFAFAGMQVQATYIFAVSAPNVAPTTFPNVKAGQDKIVITVGPGSGSKLSEEEVRKGSVAVVKSGGDTAQLTAEQKKQQAEFDAKKAEIEEKNIKAEKSNVIFDRAIKEGNDAFTAKNYDLAIVKYDEGIAADPDFVGSAPVFYNNRGSALTARAVDTYNKSIKITDATEKIANLSKVKKDFADAAQGYVKSWNVLKNAPAAEIADRTVYDAAKLGALQAAKDTFQKAVKTEQVSTETIEAAKILIPEYLNIETDAAKKAEGSLLFADLYRIAEDRESAIAAYKKVLLTSPDNVDALALVGIVLVDLGWIKDNDKALSQEGANYLQKFVSIAPDTHKLKPGAVEYLGILKTQSIVPVKQTPARKKN